MANFYPAIASRLSRFVYTNTQSRIHVIVTHGFLRSLARLDFEESRVGRFVIARRGARPVHAAAERAQRHAPGFVTFAPRGTFQGHASLATARPRCSPPRCSPPTAARRQRRHARHRGPGRAQPGRQRRLPGVGRAGRRRALAADRSRARRLGDHAGHRRLRRAPAPADRLDPVRRRRAGACWPSTRAARARRPSPAATSTPTTWPRAPSRRSPSWPRRPTARPRRASSSGALAFVRRGGGPKPGVYYWALGSSKARRSG